MLVTLLTLVFSSVVYATDEYAADFSEYIFENIAVNQTLEIKFDKALDSSTVNINNVHVYKKETNENVAINVKLDESKKKILITPKVSYKYNAKYLVVISKLKYSDKTEKATSVYEITTQKKEEDPDAIFKQEGIEKYLTTQYVEIEDGIVYFDEKGSNPNPYEHYRPQSETIDNDKLNTILYNLLKSRIEENERENLTVTGYLREMGDEYIDPFSYVYVDLHNSSKYVYSSVLYGFTFQEKGYLEDSNPYKAPIYLELESLVSDDWDKWPCEKYYVERLRKDLKVIFGDVGSDICDYVVEQKKYRTTVLDPFEHKKDFGDMTVYAVLPEYRTLTFYFLPKESTEKEGGK
jgi:hypothetical protein